MATYYKYRAYDTNALAMLVNRELYFSDPAHFNDPYDCQLNISLSLQEAIERAGQNTKDKVSGFLKKHITLSELYEKIQRDVKTTGILSLCKKCNDVLMWSHYADEHRGFCAGFNLSKELTQLNEQHEIVGLESVKYFKDNPYFDFFHECALLSQQMPYENFWNRLFIIGLLSKSSSWKHEEEVRIVKRTPGSVPFAPKELAHIIFGLRTTTKNEKTVRAILGAPEWKHVKYKRVVRKGAGFSLKVVPA